MNIVKFFDNKKFMWDGKIYNTESETNGISVNYEKDKFEVRVIKEEEKYLLYTRRVAAQQAAETK